ncbi:Sensor histidine kinase LiaS [Streptomyces sp. YIM 130001]|uniref:sensor histidine kinase n=1 Tax=Streptomyces sp. YIM 130001 TaxID=2259644 RepID=UPI000E64B79E|nr:sensor histidine kinase [Streptomyces sp. YIM 130001]RII18612.1 Sensor histidine kinase LiaS [Streptomyces sp. YIM 130001]
MTPATGARSPDVWEGTFRLWDGYFAVVWAATLVFVLGTGDPGQGVRLTTAGLLGLLLPLYLLLGRRVLIEDGADVGRARTYMTLAILLFLPAGTLMGETRLMAFALVPQCYMALRRAAAQISVTVVNIVPVAGWALLWPVSGQDVFYNLVFALVTLVFSVAMGHWIIGIIEQSEERAVLIRELEASRGEVSRLSAAHGALAERERMSREIHDTLAQGFTSVLMLAQVLDGELESDVPAARRHLAMLTRTARQNLDEARNLVADGGPADLRGASLPDALRRLAARHSSPATVDVRGQAAPLPPGIEVVALRACQEALANTRKHAGEGVSVAIRLSYVERELRVDVTDDGYGFAPVAPRDGYGLSGLRARAAEVGGVAEIDSAPGSGTRLSVRLPLPSTQPVPPRSIR